MKVKLKEAFDLQMGKTPARNNVEFWDGTHKWISIADLGNAGKYINSTKERISDEGIEASGIKMVPKGTVIMSFKLSIGKTAITSEDMYTNEAIMAFHSKGTYEVDVDYLYHLCCGTNWGACTNKAVMGLTLNKATLSEYEIEIPDISEQRGIARKLDKLDSIIARRKTQMVALEELVKSRFVELFGDPLNGSAKYPIHQVGDVAESVDPQPSHRTPPIDENGIPYVSTKDCDYKTGKIDFEGARKVSRKVLEEHLNRYTLHEGDFVIGKIGTIGNPVFVPARDDYTLSANIVLVQPNSNLVSPYFLKYSFESDFVERQFAEAKNSTSQAAFGIQKVRMIKVMNPDLNIQRGFENFVKQVDKSKHLHHIASCICRQAMKIYEQERMSCRILSS